MTKSRDILTRRRYWSADEEQFLLDWYPHVHTADLAAALGRAEASLYTKAQAIGLRKTREYVVETARERSLNPSHGGRRNLFRVGLVPWNKGSHYVAGGRSAQTRFKPGRPAHEARNYLPIGSLRINADGVLERKVTDDPSLVPARRWVGVHRLVWEVAHGPVPAGHAVVFRSGMKTAELERITLDALELITRQQLMARNTVHRLPPEVSKAVQLMGALRRRINDIERKDSSQ